MVVHIQDIKESSATAGAMITVAVNQGRRTKRTYPTALRSFYLGIKKHSGGFPGGPVVKSSPSNAGDKVWEDPTGLRATKPMCHNY